MKKLYRLTLILGLAAVIAIADWVLFHRDWMPLLWHLKHGRHIASNGLQFAVPLLYQEDHGTLAGTMAFYEFPGRFSRKSAAITIHFDKSNSVPAMGDSFSRKERSANLGGRTGQCVEYVAKHLRYVKINNMEIAFPAWDAPTHIYCDFGDRLSASFSGDFAAKDDFYTFIANAESVTRK